jgi:hypothetical protein
MKLLLAAVAAIGLSGCIVHRGHVHGPAVVIGRDHRHDDHCGHYFHKGNWHHHPGHIHRAGCGHLFRGGIWIVVD